MKILLPYGEDSIDFEVPSDVTYYIVSSKLPSGEGVDQDKLIDEALSNPIGLPKLDVLLKRSDRVCVLITDKTRATPNRVILPILLSRIREAGVSKDDISIIIANGLHKPMSRGELEEFLGSRIPSEYNVINHVADDEDSLRYMGRTSFGTLLYVNRIVAESDFRISVGLVEPHFFAGYSGGRKLILPGVSGVKSIYMNHSFKMLSHPLADYGYTDGNPVHEDMMEAASIIGLEYTVNVIVGRDKRMIYASSGSFVEAHRKAIDFLSSMVCVKVPFQADITITTNGGYPLDRDLYQTVKGMVTASRITRDKGVIIVVSECRDGVGHADFKELASMYRDPRKILEYIKANEPLRDQWEVQKLAQVLCKNNVVLVSRGVREEEALDMNFKYASTVEEAYMEALRMVGKVDVKVAFIPEGPYVIPDIR